MLIRALPEALAGWRADKPDERRRRWPCCASSTGRSCGPAVELGPAFVPIYLRRATELIGLRHKDFTPRQTHSRPYVSGDNPYSESRFRTLKYRPEFPDRLGCIQDSRAPSVSGFSSGTTNSTATPASACQVGRNSGTWPKHAQPANSAKHAARISDRAAPSERPVLCICILD